MACVCLLPSARPCLTMYVYLCVREGWVDGWYQGRIHPFYFSYTYVLCCWSNSGTLMPKMYLSWLKPM